MMKTRDSVLITPEMAKEFLKRNTNNRKIKTARINKYAAEMARGKWQINPEGISFYENGTLRDGQNRLLAIIKANTPTYLNMTTGVPNDSVICDRGAGRSLGDILYMSGLTDLSNNTAQGVINLAFRYATGKQFTISEVAAGEFAGEYQDEIARAVATGNAGGADYVCRKSSVCLALFCANLGGVDPKVLNRFCVVANTGHQSDASEDAAITFRNQIMKDYKGKTAGTSSQIEIFNLACQAIHDFQRCETRKRKYSLKEEIPYARKLKAIMAFYI